MSDTAAALRATSDVNVILFLAALERARADRLNLTLRLRAGDVERSLDEDRPPMVAEVAA